MQRHEVLAILTKHQEAIKNYRIKSLAIFGSVARDEAKPDSDVDILVEFEGTVTFDRYMDFRTYANTKVSMKNRHFGTRDMPAFRTRVRSLKPGFYDLRA
ncbi:nucleotidyltransferase family protein [Microseira wollei]|uniref:DNA polymerase beta domain protein region n=1 Tax=Microseira wollei NIES-4236 TaxID=2530354 RepID=A0AAV3X6Z7_9CYAN|nr:nucleotidyltransferase domain-containing protein [Microseira wollei]GET36371.1 DNA polymerase beta domain protein region [Microseira wollei NIES-4236]